LRIAGAATQRDGFDYNTITEHNINGRDLWGARTTLAFEPGSRFRANLIWERFEEDDNRSRTGKQLCHRDDGLTTVGSTPVVTDPTVPNDYLARPAIFSTGCKAGSLYDDAAFGTPNGLSLPFVLSSIYNSQAYPWGYIPDPTQSSGLRGVNLLEVRDPYGGLEQSRDLREIASVRDPIYRAKADIFQLNMEFDLADSLTLNSQTMYFVDGFYSCQDYIRIISTTFFRDTTDFVPHPSYGESAYRQVAPGGIFCDPQIGCTDRMAGFDVSRSDAEKFSQEFRLT